MPADNPNLPSFDARNFEPPAWATESFHDFSKEPTETQAGDKGKAAGTEDDVASDDDPGDLDLGVEGDDPLNLRFTTAELKKLLALATSLKNTGNKAFTKSPQDLDAAKIAYLSALEHLPEVGKAAEPPKPPNAEPQISEVTDEEASVIEEAAEAARQRALDDEKAQRFEVEIEIRECTKAVWGNLAAVYLTTGENKEAAEACTKALDIDGAYVKAVHRRAQANERIGSWSSLTTSQEDYNHLVSLLPKNSPILPAARKALSTMPQRIAAQQEKEKDEMLGKLKELGNGLLGKFGLSTDMFKFDQLESGGYNLRFGS